MVQPRHRETSIAIQNRRQAAGNTHDNADHHSTKIKTRIKIRFLPQKKGHQQEHQAYSLHIDRPSRDGSRLFDSLHDPSKHIYRRPLHRVVAHANHEVTQRPHAAYYDASPNGGSLLGRPDPDGRAHAAAAPAAAEQLSTTASSLYGGASVASHCSTVNSCCAHPWCGPVTVTST